MHLPMGANQPGMRWASSSACAAPPIWAVRPRYQGGVLPGGTDLHGGDLVEARQRGFPREASADGSQPARRGNVAALTGYGSAEGMESGNRVRGGPGVRDGRRAVRHLRRTRIWSAGAPRSSSQVFEGSRARSVKCRKLRAMARKSGVMVNPERADPRRPGGKGRSRQAGLFRQQHDADSAFHRAGLVPGRVNCSTPSPIRFAHRRPTEAMAASSHSCGRRSSALTSGAGLSSRDDQVVTAAVDGPGRTSTKRRPLFRPGSV